MEVRERRHGGWHAGTQAFDDKTDTVDALHGLGTKYVIALLAFFVSHLEETEWSAQHWEKTEAPTQVPEC